jgi:hypothetical protein
MTDLENTTERVRAYLSAREANHLDHVGESGPPQCIAWEVTSSGDMFKLLHSDLERLSR